MQSWRVTRKQDVHGNEVHYAYTRDATTREVRLVEVRWAGCYRVQLDYEARPDPVTSARAGFLHTLGHRLRQIRVQIFRSDLQDYHTYRRYDLAYQTSRWTGRSLLHGVTVVGIDAQGESRALPALSFAYVDPSLGDRRWHGLGTHVPGDSLQSADLTLVRHAGSGLPDIVETRRTGTYLRQNLGGGAFAAPRIVASPTLLALSEPGTFLSDLSGDGWADLVVNGGHRVYARGARGGWGVPYRSAEAPSFDLDAPDVRLADLTGDGIPDAIRSGASGWHFFQNLGEGRWSRAIPLLRPPPLRLEDPRVHLVDLTGDGLADLVYIDQHGVEVWPSLGFGQFGSPYRMVGAPQFGAAFDPAAVQWMDLTGSGQADLAYVQAGVVTLFFNQAGRAFAGPVEVARHRQSSHGHVEPVDLLGTGAEGLLFSDRHAPGLGWRFLELFVEGSPDLLHTLDNGIGGTTALRYGSSAAHWARDFRSGRPWKSEMPSPQRVLDEVTVTDAVTGRTLATQYRYRHGVYDGTEREFRGFARVEHIDREAGPDDPQPLPPVQTLQWFHTGAPLDLRDEWSGDPAGLPQDQIVADADARRSLRGKPIRTQIHALDGQPLPYQTTHIAYQTFRVGRGVGRPRASYVALPIVARTIHSERTRDPRIQDVETTYDLHRGRGYGLPVEVRERGYGRRGTFSTAHELDQTTPLERYTLTTYVHLDQPEPEDYTGSYTPVYLVGRPTVVERWGVGSVQDTRLSRIETYYDGHDYEGLGYPGSGTAVGLTRGRVSCQLVRAFSQAELDAAFPSGAGDGDALSARGHYLERSGDHYVHAQRVRYASNGLPVGTKDPNGHETTFAYDSTYALFPVSATDPAGHPLTLERGVLLHQVAATVDANQNRIAYTYDPSGLPASRAVMGKFVDGAWQGDPETHPTEAYVYDFTSQPIQVRIQQRQTRLDSSTFDVYRYIDGLGQTVQERHTAEPDPASPSTPRYRVTGHQVFNHKGLVVRAYQPTFSGSGDYASASTSVPSITTQYDPLGRPVRVDHPDGTFETTTYHPWVQVARDRNDNAGHLTASDARYGDAVPTFRDHLDTPTKRYLDALGRDVAVEENNGASVTPVFRITTYEIGAGAFTGTSYGLTLHQDLQANYLVFVRGSVDAAAASPSNTGARVTADPFGTGDLGTSGATDQLTLTRADASEGTGREPSRCGNV